MTTAEIDARAEQRLREAGAEPAFKGYNGYPSTICASVNEQVVHGIPSAQACWSRATSSSVDLGAKLDGYFGDSAVTVPVGRVSAEAATLLEVTAQALEEAVKVVQAGARLSDIGAAVQRHVEAHGFSVVREFVGHGIGTALHEEPQIPNYGTPGRGPRLAEGMVLAIEPMVNIGQPGVKVLSDGWTAVTRDGSLSAHFEHTVAVTADGCRVLTRPGAGRERGGVMTGARRRGALSPSRSRGWCGSCCRSALVRVSIDGRHDVVAHPGGSPARNYVRVVVGDRVRLTLSPTDRTRGRIVEKL